LIDREQELMSRLVYDGKVVALFSKSASSPSSRPQLSKQSLVNEGEIELMIGITSFVKFASPSNSSETFSNRALTKKWMMELTFGESFRKLRFGKDKTPSLVGTSCSDRLLR